MSIELIIFLVLQTVVSIYSIVRKKLNIAGTIAATLLGVSVFLGFGLKGILFPGIFFIAGNLATSWKISTKQNLGFAEKEKGKRTALQVFANGGLAIVLGVIAYIYPELHDLLFLLMAAVFSSAIADTISSELGTLYGKRFYNIITLRKDKRGENGVISFEGTLFGLAASTLIALAHALFMGFNISFTIILLAGTIGNLSDSILGATLERKGTIKNDLVNFSNTFIAVLIAYALS
jgi:uncharacterized protein (TIGR00297 family)